ncbi:kinesin-domain-containing protein [Cristinia sonorae]|uniref:Kinesin-like protein n=1 Tax=Cristinia sonorae TaxID=1940300 RepID=A0A8K0UKS3_9AGAR|nr:kinesin-domain-containing protein [Cristinia sonorae]
MSTRQVKILARIRPLIDGEFADDGLRIERDSGKSFIIAKNPKIPTQVFSFPFTSCYGPESTQEEIFMDEVDPMLDIVYSGITVTIFAYGVTSSGKTHTMQGTKAQPGIIPRAVEAMFSRRTEDTELSVSYMEIYKDEVYDLLVERETASKLSVRENQHGKVFVANQLSIPIDSESDFNELYAEAIKRRSVASTNLNRASSRSHAVLTLNVKTQVNGAVTFGKLNLVDLAGSENNKLTGNDVSRMAESSAINKSLSVLGQVVHALNTGASRIPYRNSKLTRILQDALGGNSLGLLICNIAPTLKHRQDTINTLNFASRAKNIENKPVVNQRDPQTNTVVAVAPRLPTGPSLPSIPAPKAHAGPRPSIGLKQPSRVPRPSSVAGSGPLLRDIPERREPPLLTEQDIDARIAKAVEAEVARRLAEHERQQAERVRDAELLAQQGEASHRSSLAPAFNDQPPPTEAGSRSAGDDELRQRLQDLEDKLESGNAETRMVSDLSPVSRKKAGRAYVALARAQSEKNNLTLALELYRKAESYVPDNIKLKERIIEIEWAVKNGKAFNPSPKKPKKKGAKKNKKASWKASAGEAFVPAGPEAENEQENVGSPLRRSQKRGAGELQDHEAFATPILKRSRIEEEAEVEED